MDNTPRRNSYNFDPSELANYPVELLQSFGGLDYNSIFTASMIADGLSPFSSRDNLNFLRSQLSTPMSSSSPCEMPMGAEHSDLQFDSIDAFTPPQTSPNSSSSFDVFEPSEPIAVRPPAPAFQLQPSILQQVSAIFPINVANLEAKLAANHTPQPQPAVQTKTVAKHHSSSSHDPKYVDITQLLIYSQREAAQKLGIPKSTLSKRWREATLKRKWPSKSIGKIDKDIEGIIQSVPPSFCLSSPNGSSSGSIEDAMTQPIGDEVELERLLQRLWKQRSDELRPVTIRL